MQPLQGHDPRSIGPYRLLGRLGAGGMGQVYLAADREGRVLALKVVHPALAHDEGFRSRFRHEVAATRQISGPWVAAVLDADPDAPAPWLATEYVAGPSLDRAVAGAGPLPAATAHLLAGGLARALAVVHGADVVHRDVKPSNVLLADRPRLIDFGISRAADAPDLPATGVVFGTPAFMSPEQVAGDEVGPASDMFSMGAVVVHALTGAGPFGEGTPLVLLRRIADEEPHLDALPPVLREPITACLVKNPADRPTAAELAVLLDPLPPPPSSGWLPAPVMALSPAADGAGEDRTRVEGTRQLPVPAPVRAAGAAAARIGRRALLVGAGAVAVGLGAGALAYAVTANRRPETVSATAPASVGSGPRALWSIQPPGPVEALAVRAGTLYAVLGDALHALDAATGATRWVAQGAGGYIDASGVTHRGLALGDGFALLETNGAVAAIDTDDGAQRWAATPEAGTVLTALVGAEMTAARSTVCITLAGSLHAVDARTGVRRWRYDVPATNGPGAAFRFAASPVVAGSTAYVTWGSNVTALDVGSGRVRWQFGSGADTTASIAVADGTVYMAIYTGPLVALDAGTGAPRWEAPVGSRGAAAGALTRAIVPAGDLVFVRGDDQRIHALDITSGRPRWAQPDPTVDGAAADVGPVLDAGLVYCGAGNGRLYAMDAALGVRRWEYAGPSGRVAALAAENGTVYVGGSARIEALASAGA
ncbi:serine/threonine-protein kinase [Pseudonocardia aurantiaca]|uniref:Serine/threonine-protein kinase n=1 Tax=Pseudonocardia aurantiaca TaxID=75290 RepID=A0ABW4FG08_9PSEU